MADWVRVASAAEVKEGEPFPAQLGDVDIALYRLGERIHALDDTCPHEFALLSQGFVEDGAIECPLHQARFDIATGALLDGPAPCGLRTYAVRIEGGDVLVSAAESQAPAGA